MFTPPQHDRLEGLTLTEALGRLERQGYTGQFGIAEEGLVRCFTCRKASDPRDVVLHEMDRLEGPSDPASEVAVAALQCPRCSAMGTLVLTYGPGGAPEDGEVLRRLRDRRPTLAH